MANKPIIFQINSVDEYIEVQKKAFEKGLTWPNKTKTVRQSQLNPAKYVVINYDKQLIQRFFSLEQVRNNGDYSLQLPRPQRPNFFLKG